MKKQTNFHQLEAMETIKLYSWILPPPVSIAKSTHYHGMNRKQKTNSWMKTWPKDISHLQTPHMVFPHSWSQRKTQKKNDISSTTALLTMSPEKMSPHFQILNNVLKTYKEWSYSANLTFDGDTTTSVFEKAINGKRHSKHVKAFLNQKSCSSECQILLPVSNAL